MKKIADIRQEYTAPPLDIPDLDPDPLKEFEKWFGTALAQRIEDANAMTLATVDENQRPFARIVLLKGLDDGGFTFFTNYNSLKAQQLEHHPYGALVFFWNQLHQQIRIQGKVQRVSASISDDYFKTRPVGSQYGAWASPQSSTIPSRDMLEKNMESCMQQYPENNIPRPEHWGGYSLLPDRIEFWQGRPNRLHDRFLYTQKSGSWQIERLAP